MYEIDLSQAVKEALQNLVQELSQSYSLPAYLKPLLDGEATVVFKVFKGKVQITSPILVMPTVAVTEEINVSDESDANTPELEAERIIIEKPEPKHNRKRKSEV